ncbi:MAG: KH domain-containing protein [Bacilli bacterium]|nr:KH domain-containing protein [Bacilli bacterium]
MDLVELTEYLVKSLVTDPDSVSVKEFDDEEGINIEVIVSNDDIGTVIGRGGSNANAIRTLVQAAAYTKKLPRVRINIDSKEA